MKIKFLCIIIIQLLFFSCQKSVLNEMETLNPAGERFMELISTYENWQTDWENMNKIGTPLPNEASVRFLAPQNSYYIMPIVNGKEIISVALYPLLIEEENRLVTASPTVIEKKDAKDNSLLQRLLKSELFSSWQEKGYVIKFENNDKVFVQNLSLSRHTVYENAHMFCVDAEVKFYYRDEEEYMECLDGMRRAVNRYVYQMTTNGFYVTYESGAPCAYIDASFMSYDEAATIFIACYEEM